jgi:hypothetical protein
MRIAYLLLVVMLFSESPVGAGEPLAIITAASNPLTTLSLDNLKLIYLRKSLVNATGKRWIPVNLTVDDPLRRGFSLELFSQLPEDQEDYWNNQYFNGIMPPEVLASEEAVLQFVSITEGAIGYISKRKVDKRVKVLRVITPPATSK